MKLHIFYANSLALTYKTHALVKIFSVGLVLSSLAIDVKMNYTSIVILHISSMKLNFQI